jgi:hypothetical protein
MLLEYLTRTMPKTSEMADSTTSVDLVISLIFKPRTMGTTTAGDIIPKTAPIYKAGSGACCSTKYRSENVTPAVIKNVYIDNKTQSLSVLRRVSNVRWLPPSKSIRANAIALNIEPKFPKLDSSTKLNPVGPITIPIKISGSTSGTLVRSNRAVKKCATKTNKPTDNTEDTLWWSMNPLWKFSM